LGILISNTKPDEAITLCRRAYELNPNPKYSYTLAFYQHQNGKSNDAVKVLLELIENQPTYVDAYLMLGDIFEKQGNPEDARAVYQEALSEEGISQKDKYRFQALLRQGIRN
jgi:tetratricopeptide (TPR) repeat protein